MRASTNAFPYDLAISAVPYDAALVNELCATLSARLHTKPVWEGHAPPSETPSAAALVADRSRMALVLHQRLWQNEEATRADANLLRERLRERPDSVCVMTLDDTPVPSWLAKVPRIDLTAEGLEAAAQAALEVLASSGGALVPAPTPADAPERTGMPWHDGPPPFLAQPRAQSALRRELDAISTALKPSLDLRRTRQPEGLFELHLLPQRVIVRMNDKGVSFSWVAGRTPSVADGRLLVIEWEGVATEKRGVAALASAKAVREVTYRAESDGAEHWRWRTDSANGRAFSTPHLVAEWIAIAEMGRER